MKKLVQETLPEPTSASAPAEPPRTPHKGDQVTSVPDRCDNAAAVVDNLKAKVSSSPGVDGFDFATQNLSAASVVNRRKTTRIPILPGSSILEQTSPATASRDDYDHVSGGHELATPLNPGTHTAAAITLDYDDPSNSSVGSGCSSNYGNNSNHGNGGHHGNNSDRHGYPSISSSPYNQQPIYDSASSSVSLNTMDIAQSRHVDRLEDVASAVDRPTPGQAACKYSRSGMPQIHRAKNTINTRIQVLFCLIHPLFRLFYNNITR